MTTFNMLLCKILNSTFSQFPKESTILNSELISNKGTQQASLAHTLHPATSTCENWGEQY